MAENNDGAYSGPLSPEEKAECDRELEEMTREINARIARMTAESIQKAYDRYAARRAQYLKEITDDVGVSDEVVRQLSWWKPTLPKTEAAGAPSK